MSDSREDLDSREDRDPRDDLLRDLGARAREEAESEARELDERWTRLAAGTATESEIDELRALAEQDPRAAQKWQAFRPLDTDFRRRLAGAALQHIASEKSAQVPGTQSAQVPGTRSAASPEVPDTPSESSSKVPIPFRRTVAVRLLAVAATLVLMIGLLLQTRGPRSEGLFTDLSVSGNRSRSLRPPDGLPDLPDTPATSPLPGLESGRDVFLTLRIGEKDPAASVPLHRVSLFMRDDEGTLHPLTLEHETRAAGKIDLRATIPAVPSGQADLIVAIHPGRTVTTEQVRGSWKGRLTDVLYGSWQRMRREVRVTVHDPDLTVEFAGCSAVRAPPTDTGATEPICELGESLRLWVSSNPLDAIDITLNGRPVPPADGEPTAGGLAFLFQSPVPGRLTVRAGTGPSTAVQHIRLVPPRTDELRRQAAEVRKRGRIAFARGRTVEAVGLLRESAELHRRLGLISTQIDDLNLVFYALLERMGKLEEARALLDALPEPAGGDGTSAFLASFSRGTLALETGRLADALRHLADAARHSERIGWSAHRNMAEQQLMRILRRLGRGSQADDLRTRLAGELHLFHDCQKPTLVNNLAWDHLRSFNPETPEPAQHLAPTLELLRTGLNHLDRCRQPVNEEKANLHLNTAMASLYAGKASDAEKHLRLASSIEGGLPPRLKAWQLDLQARLSLHRGRAHEALATAQTLAVLAEQGQDPEAGWRAARLEAEASEALGDFEGALRAYAVAERRLDKESGQVPLDADRASSLTARSRATGAHLDLLLRQGEVDTAFEVARHARVRLYRGELSGAAPRLMSRSELEAWVAARRRFRSEIGESASLAGSTADAARRLEELAAAVAPLDRRLEALGLGSDQPLPEPAPEELILLFHPLVDGAWVGFGAIDGQVQAHRFPSIKLADSPHLLTPFADLIAEAATIRILPMGPLVATDFHALPVHGGPLVESVPVVYGLDLPVVGPNTGADTHPTALLIADPGGDLPAARAELEIVRSALRKWRHLSVEPHSAQSVLGALHHADLLHFAGHADFAGRDGLDSHLRLAGADRLSAADLLSSEATVPQLVVLSACASARSTVDPFSPGLGLAHAFLLRGSHMVLGATEPVDDRLTRRLMELFYRTWNGDAVDAPRALQRAQLALRAEDPRAWKAFRLLTR